jgi:hypothetical protein
VVDVVHQWVQEWTAEEVQDQVPAVAEGWVILIPAVDLEAWAEANAGDNQDNIQVAVEAAETAEEAAEAEDHHGMMKVVMVVVEACPVDAVVVEVPEATVEVLVETQEDMVKVPEDMDLVVEEVNQDMVDQ